MAIDRTELEHAEATNERTHCSEMPLFREIPRSGVDFPEEV